MTAAPPFVHPAPDPTPEIADRVLARVEATARRRRARRRVAVAAGPVVAVVALLTVAAVARGRDDGGVVTATEPAPTTTTEPPFDQLAIEPETHWNTPILSADGRTLEISVSTSCGSDGGSDHDVVETPDSVIVAVGSAEDEATTSAPNGACGLEVSIDTIEIPLQDPLGGRDLYDGIDPEPRDDVLRKADLVEVTYVPAGFEAVEEETYMTSIEEPWQRNFRAPAGAGWYFAVMQVPTRYAAQWRGDDEPITPITIDGHPAELITGQFSGSMETIRFELGDLTVSVWSEGPNPSDHRDELVRIAEGIRPPSG